MSTRNPINNLAPHRTQEAFRIRDLEACNWPGTSPGIGSLELSQQVRAQG